MDQQNAPEPTALLHVRFARQASATPDAIAVRHGAEAVRYAELADGAARLAGALRGRGIGPGSYVGLHVERSIASVEATLAILDAGAAVVPLPPSYPAARRRAIIDFAGLDAVVDSGDTPVRQLFDGHVLRADGAFTEAPLRVPEPVDPDQPAFVLSSSGSTGAPKLIVRSHRSFFHRLEWTWRELPFGSDERCCQKSHMTTTHAIYELFEPLLAGVPVTVVDDAALRDLEGFWDSLRTERVTRLLIVPSLLRASLEMPDFEAPRLRALTLMGEAVDGALADRVVAAFGETPSIVSIYGSTEASSSLVVDLRAERRPGEPPALGVPLDAAIEAAVLDDELRPVADGETGMLHLAGPQLFTEYLADAAGTDAVFAACPDGRRRYRTSDLVRRDPDGSLQFVGRTGDTVKVRGFRIDVREVEAALAAQDGVLLAAVVPVEGALAGFVAPATLSAAELTRALGDRLPSQMIPSVIVALDEFPRAANGKIDRARLAARLSAPPAAARATFGSETEARVAEIWSEVLGPVAIAPTTSFFEAGGTSLTVFAVVHRLRDAFGLVREQLNDLAVYREPTVAGLARHIDELVRGVAHRADAGTGGVVVSLRAGVDPALDPVFLIASAGGTLGAYEKVVARLAGPRPVLGVRDPLLWGERDPVAGFDAWVDGYVAAIRERQPAGPYRLVAYSSAGAFGWEIARRLRQADADVAMLALVDPVALDQGSPARFGFYALRARSPLVPHVAVRAIVAAGRARAALPARRQPVASSAVEWQSTPEAYAQFADEVRHDRGHLRRLSALLELGSGLPVALTEADLDAVSPEGYVGLLHARFREAGSEVEEEALDRLVVQYELQVRTQHAYRLGRYDGPVVVVEPAGRHAGLVAAQLRPYVRRLESRVLAIGEPSARVRELMEAFPPGFHAHFRCMRDDVFAAALAVELDGALDG